MPPGKRKLVDVKWVDENIVSQIPEECLKKVKLLQESVDQWKQNMESGLPLVSCIKLLVCQQLILILH